MWVVCSHIEEEPEIWFITDATEIICKMTPPPFSLGTIYIIISPYMQKGKIVQPRNTCPAAVFTEEKTEKNQRI